MSDNSNNIMKKFITSLMVAAAMLIGCSSNQAQKQATFPQIVSVSNVGTTNMIVGKTNVQAMLVIVEVQPQVVQFNDASKKVEQIVVPAATATTPSKVSVTPEKIVSTEHFFLFIKRYFFIDN